MGYGRWTRRVAAGAVAAVVALASGCGGGDGDGDTVPAPPTTAPAGQEPGLHELTLESGGQEREYLLDVPTGYRPGEPVALVLVLHAGRSDPQSIRVDSEMEQFANRYGVLVAYPEGVDRFWRPAVEGEHGIGVEFGGDPTDLDFLRDLVAHLVREWGVEPGEVYAAGHSNGAAMSYRLAAEAADVVAAIAPVGGYILDPPAVIEPAEPVSVVGFVGLAADAIDEITAGLDTWRDRLGCEPGEPAPVGEDGRVTRTAASCEDGSEVVEYAIERMPHVWPRQSHGIDAHEVMWEFFTDHARSA